MVVGVSGYGYTGSGAMLDFLKEFRDCECVFDEEFMLPYCPHGLQDLEYHLMTGGTRYFSSDIAIKEYKGLIKNLTTPRSMYRKKFKGELCAITDQYIVSIADLIWEGCSCFDRLCSDNFIKKRLRFTLYSRLIRLYEKVTKKRYPFPTGDRMYLSVCPERFLENTKSYIREVLQGFQCNLDKIVVLNQPFDVNDPRRSMKFFDNPKAIIVDRDPRDVYLLFKRGLSFTYSFTPSGSVDDFIKYYLLNRVMNNYSEDEDIIRIRYEDMIYQYNEVCEKVISFLGLDGSGWMKGTCFDPEVSINNTQLFMRFPEYMEDIKKIEQEIPEYLYPFEQFIVKPTYDSEIF